jgi:hypothetical protein
MVLQPAMVVLIARPVLRVVSLPFMQIGFRFLPSSSGLLTISSCSGGADTRLWLYRGNCNNLDLIASSDDFCDFAPQEPYAAAVFNIQVNENDTLYLEWDDAWDTRGFDFEIVLNPISENLVLDGWEIPFTSIPVQQLAGDIPIPVNVRNLGSMEAQTVRIATEIWEEGATLAIDTFFTDTFSLVPGQNRGFLMGPIPRLQAGNYFLLQRLIYQGPDDMPADNQQTSRIFSITPNEFASDDGNYQGGIGVSGPGVFYLGQFFDTYFEDTIRSIRYNIAGGNPGDTIFAEVYSYNGLTGAPQDKIRTSDPYLVPPNALEWIEIPLDVPLPVGPGEKYLFGLAHHATGTELNLGVSKEIFKPSYAWFALNSPDWVPIEALNPQGGDEYNLALAIRPVTDLSLVSISVTVDMREESISPEGVWLEYGDASEAKGSLQLTDSGNGLYTGTIEVDPFEDVYYTFFNGIPQAGGQRELVPSTCSTLAYMGIAARRITAPTADIDVPKVCFGACTVCPPAPCNDPTFIICDDVEYYNAGDVTPQAPHWNTWDANSDGGIVTMQEAASGLQSIVVDGGLPNLSQDVLLQLDNSGMGKYVLSFEMYVPSGKSAYFGLLHERNPESFGWDIYLDRLDQGYIYQGTEELTSFNFPSDSWFSLRWEIDIMNDFNTISLDGMEIWAGQFSVATDISGGSVPNSKSLNSINFYPFDDLYEFYIDDVYFQALPAATGDVCFGAVAIDSLFGQSYGEPQIGGSYGNQNNTTTSFDPTIGNDCFSESDNPWQQTIWFEFMGDGNTYEIAALTDPTGPCAIQESFTNGDAQFAIYSGECGNLQPVGCAENNDNSLAPSVFLETQAGTNYYLVLDGTDIYSSVPSGNFCISVTRIESTAEVTFFVDMRKYIADGGNISNEGVFLGGSVTDGVLLKMDDAGNQIYKSTISVVQDRDYDYSFYNGTDEQENLAFLAPCIEPDSMQGRWLQVEENDIQLDTVCFNYCVACDSLTSTKHPIKESFITAFPNPTNQFITISATSPNLQNTGSLRMYNSLGETIVFLKDIRLPYVLDCSQLPVALYRIEYLHEKGRTILPVVVE